MVNDKYVVKYLDPRTGKYEYATVKDIGDLQKLNTKVKTSIVDAINSISIDEIGALRNNLDTIGNTIKSLEDGTLELGDFQSIDDVVSREIEDAINSLKLENSGLLQLTQEEINTIVSNAESDYRDSIAASVRELETSKADLEAAREKMTTIGQMLENADIDYSNLSQVVDDINLYITDVIEKTDFDMVNGIVSDYKTAVTQTQDGWGVDASRNMLSYLTGRVKSNETSLDVQHGLIQAKVGKDEFQYMTVDNLPAGNENMLHNTSDLRDWNFSSAFIFKSADDYRFTSIVQSDSAGENIMGTTDELEQGVTYAISTYVNVQSKSKNPGEEKYAPTDGLYTATVIIDGDTIELNNVVEDNSALDGWKRVSGTFVAKRTAQQDIKFYVTAFNRDTQVGYLSAPKLEKGSSATSWIPHIEDNVSTILSQNAVMRVLSDRITSSVEEVRETKGAFETATSTFNQIADGFELNTNKLSEVLDKYGEVTGVQTQQASELEVLNTAITSKVWKQDINTTLDTINIDTSNRIVNSAFNIYSYDEQTGALKLDYWDNNTGFAIKKHSQSLDNYLYATRSNATSVNPISIKSSPFALRDGEKILFNFESLAVGNPLDDDNVFTLEMYDNNDVRVGLQEFRLSELKKEFLTAYDVGDSYKYNGTYIVENSSVVKGTITLKLPKNGELWLTKVMFQNAGIGTIGWTPSSVDNQIIQSKLSTEINQLADSIELVANDERLDAISGLLVKKDGKITISPEAIVSRVTSQELGDNALITQTSLVQTEDNLRFDLVDKEGIIQTINASSEGLLIDFDKVQIDGELIARMISAQSIDATQGFRLTDNNGNTLLGVVNDNGTPTLSIARDFNVKFKDFSNKLDVTVVNVVDEYYHSTDESRPVGGQWTSAPNDFRGDTFVWKRTKVVLQSGKEYYLPDENGINITSGWNYAKGEVTNAIESAIEEAEQATQAAQGADGKASTALEKAGTNANVLDTHQNTLNTIQNTTIPNINSAISDAAGEAQSALSSAGSAISEAQSALSSAKAAMDEAKLADGKIADYVTKNGLVNGTTVDSKIDTAKGEISQTITTVEGKIPTEIGGRNYLTGTSRTMVMPRNIATSHGNWGIWYGSPGLIVGETYTISFEVKSSTATYLSFIYLNPQNGSLSPNIAISKDWTRVKTTFVFKGGTYSSENQIAIHIYPRNDYSGVTEVRKLKLEKGSIATDWTPAPEDNVSVADFDIFKYDYSQDVKGTKETFGKYTPTENLDGTVASYLENTTSRTAGAIETKLSDYQTTTGLDGAVANLYTNKNTQTAKKIETSLTEIEGKIPTYVGSRNLALNSDAPVSTAVYLLHTYELTEFDPTKTYTVSVKGKPNTVYKAYINGSGSGNHFSDTNQGNNELTLQKNGVYTKTATPRAIPTNSSPILNIYGTDGKLDTIEWVKFEQGSVATDWSPAPEDMQSVSGLDSNISAIYSNENSQTSKAIDKKLSAYIPKTGLDSSVKSLFTNESTETAKEIKRSLTTIESKIPTSIGNRNYIQAKLSPYTPYHSFSSSDDGRSFKFTMTNSNNFIVFNNGKGTAYDGIADTYTFSAYILVNGEIPATTPLLRSCITTYSPEGTSEYDATTGRLVITQKMTSFAWTVHMNIKPELKASGTVIEFKDANIVRGSKPSDWTPAPEDMQSVAGLDSSIKSIYSNTSSETAKAINKTLSAFTPKDELDEEVSILLTNTSSQTAEKINSKLTAVEGKIPTYVGGRNLLRNSNFANGVDSWDGIGGGIKNDGGLNYITIVGTFDVSQGIHTDKGQAYTVSALVRKATGTNSRFSVKFNADNDDTPGVLVTNSEWTRISATRIATTTGRQPLFFHTRNDFPIDIAELKIEKGNVATDWSPAPEDMLGKATFASFTSEYDETAKGILSRLKAIDSSEEGSVVTRLNATKKTADENSNTLTKVNNIITIQDTRSNNQIPRWYRQNYPKTTVQEFKDVAVIRDSNIPSTTGFGVLTTTIQWNDTSGGTIKQVFSKDNLQYVRRGWTDDSGWSPWVKMTDQEDIKNFVSSTSTEYQTIKERSDLYERVIGSSTEAAMKQKISRVVMTDSAFKTEVVEKMDINARIANGKPLAQDPNFEKGLEGLEVYNNSNNGNVIFQRMPTTSTHASAPAKDYIFEIKSLGQAAPNRGGFRIVPKGGSDAWYEGGEYVLDMVAKLPVGASMDLNNNSLGTGGELKWLTDNKGTGQYKRYQAYAKLGAGHHSIPIFYVSIVHAGSDIRWYQFARIEVLDINYSLGSSITQLSDNINLKVSKGDLISQINVQAGSVLITSGTNKLNVTPTTTYIENGTIKSAMIDTISASKIKTGTLDADLITSGIASKTGNRVTITNTGMKVSDSSFETEFINGGPSFFTKSSTGRTFMGEIGDMTNAVNSSKALGIKGAYNIPVVLGIQSSPTDTTYTGKVIVHNGGVAVFDRLQVEGDIFFTENGKASLKNIAGVDKLWFHEQSYITASVIKGTDGSSLPDTAAWINLQAQWGVNFWYQNQKKARQYGNRFQFWCNIEPQSGYSVSGSSDARLKHNITDVKESSLEKLGKIQFKNFTWNSNNKDDFGFIAQEVINIIPEVIEESEDGYYRYNSTRFNMIVAHATKELNDKVKFLENKIERLERIIDGN